jgi:hypothetical protein
MFGTFAADRSRGFAETIHAIAAGLSCGSRLFGLASERTFRRVCHGMIRVAAIAGLPVQTAYGDSQNCGRIFSNA